MDGSRGKEWMGGFHLARKSLLLFRLILARGKVELQLDPPVALIGICSCLEALG